LQKYEWFGKITAPKQEPEKTAETITTWPSNGRDKILMDRICKITKNWWSPLCNNWSLYNAGKAIFEARKFSREVALGIMYAESHIWANYYGTCDKSWNNWGGIKWRKIDNGDNVKDQKIPNWRKDYNWNSVRDKWEVCRLYKFNSTEDYFVSKANTLWLWYGDCMNRWSNYNILRCISFAYVWDRNVAEKSWINNALVIAR